MKRMKINFSSLSDLVLASSSLINTSLRMLFGAALLLNASYYLGASDFVIWSLVSTCGAIIYAAYLLLGTAYGRYISFVQNGLSPHEFRRRIDVVGRKKLTRAADYYHAINRMILMTAGAFVILITLVGSVWFFFIGVFKPISLSPTTLTFLFICSFTMIASMPFSMCYANIIGSNTLVKYHIGQVPFWAVGLLALGIMFFGELASDLEALLIGSTFFYLVGPLTSAIIYWFIRFDSRDTSSALCRRIRKILWFDIKKNIFSFFFGISARNFSSFFVPLALGSSFDAAGYLFIRRIFDVIEALSVSVYQAFAYKISSLNFLENKGEAVTTIRYLNYLSSVVIGISGLTLLIASELKFFDNFGILDEKLDNLLLVCFTASALLVRWGGGWMFVMNCLNNVVEHRTVMPYFLVNIFLSIFLFDLLDVLAFPLAGIGSVLIAMACVGRSVYSFAEIRFWEFEKGALLLFGCILISELIIIAVLRLG